MDELDARLRAMAKREDWALPAAYESAMDGLEEQIRQGGTLDRPGKRRLGKRVLILAAIVAVLLAATAVSMDFWNVRVEDVLVGQESSSLAASSSVRRMGLSNCSRKSSLMSRWEALPPLPQSRRSVFVITDLS